MKAKTLLGRMRNLTNGFAKLWADRLKTSSGKETRKGFAKLWAASSKTSSGKVSRF